MCTLGNERQPACLRASGWCLCLACSAAKLRAVHPHPPAEAPAALLLFLSKPLNLYTPLLPTGDWHRDAAIQVFLMALSTEKTPLQARILRLRWLGIVVTRPLVGCKRLAMSLLGSHGCSRPACPLDKVRHASPEFPALMYMHLSWHAPMLLPVQAAIALEQQLWEDCRGEGEAASLHPARGPLCCWRCHHRHCHGYCSITPAAAGWSRPCASRETNASANPLLQSRPYYACRRLGIAQVPASRALHVCAPVA